MGFILLRLLQLMEVSESELNPIKYSVLMTYRNLMILTKKVNVIRFSGYRSVEKSELFSRLLGRYQGR